jgi:ribosome-binding protein aMBF1 (putative translation factor)
MHARIRRAPQIAERKRAEIDIQQRYWGASTDPPKGDEHDRRSGNHPATTSRCGIVNDALRSRSGRGKMSVDVGEIGDMNPQQAKRLGRHLRATREALGISARELARRIDLSDSTVVRIEQGLFLEPNPEKLQRIAEALDDRQAQVY